MPNKVIWSVSFNVQSCPDKFAVHAAISDYPWDEPIKKLSEALAASGFTPLYRCRMYDDDGAVIIYFEVSKMDSCNALEKGLGDFMRSIQLFFVK